MHQNLLKQLILAGLKSDADIIDIGKLQIINLSKLSNLVKK